ncbi:MAG: GGDEF domain-containing protein [Planctomycetes bacterium]|nr:GGDEF domain-containing protein [Planctomycetota bacterium]
MAAAAPAADGSAVLCTAAGAAAAAAAPLGLAWPWALTATAVAALYGLWRSGLPALLALVPGGAVALPELVAERSATLAEWAGWSAASCLAALSWQLARQRAAERELWPLRLSVREAERAAAALRQQIACFPRLLDGCMQLAAARDIEHGAATLVNVVRELAPAARDIQVFAADGADNVHCVSGCANAATPRAADDDERYVIATGHPLIRRHADQARIIVPLYPERATADEEAAAAWRGALSVQVAGQPEELRVAIDAVLTLARIAGITLATLALVETARSSALRDDLTGLFGRVEFLRRLEELIAHARRQGAALALIACDMDHLKRYNDTYGHPAGDQALRAVARALQQTLPAAALACRWGGEEFCAALLVRDAEEGRRVAEELRRAIAATVPEPRHPERRVSASLGLALLRAGETASSALARADAALYRAKHEGRNRVVSAP